jgi:hypothetical protein
MRDISEEEAERLFRKTFPMFRGKLPINRGGTDFEGEPDDAQIMDEPSCCGNSRRASATW